MFKFFKKIFNNKNLQPLNKVLLYKENILFNIWYLQWKKLWNEIFPVLKSNAYGHWLKEVTQILEDFPSKYLVVDSLPEFFIAKKYTNKDFLLIWETNPANYLNLGKRITLAVYNISTIKYLLNSGKQFKVHLFLNTWMNREWIQHKDLINFLETIKKHKNAKNITVEWVMSHLHSAEAEDTTSVQEQINEFKVMFYKIIDYWHNILYKHIWNSAWIFTVDDPFFNARRPWFALYWFNPLPSNHKFYKDWEKLKPSLKLTSKVVSLQNLEAWYWVSYNHKFKAKWNTKIATIPFGYREWLPRNLLGKLNFYVWEQAFLQVGTICMNLCCFEDKNKEIKLYDEVEIISPNKEKSNSLKKLSDKYWVFIDEFLVNIADDIRREIVH